MADTPSDLKYTRDHEWIRTLDNGKVRIGITEFAQKQLGDIVYVELPKVKDKFDAGEPFGSIESVKAVSEVYVPVAGTVAAVNESLDGEPESVNDDPYGDGWLIELTLAKAADLNGLLSAAKYEEYLREEA
ncbi:glycine cleavage system protein GcvH [Kitasatospora sp. NPDC052896]|uniref:glycine cleavage system protein GcvH n=1 Tax=Kitasatospora sp. NPDC052896 TaxID=3364061 RepID=UPI0037CA6171